MLAGHTKEKLEQVIRVLEGVKAQNFDLAIWYSERPEHTPECGTVACAIGHAAMDPWFNERGLTLHVNDWCGGEVSPRYRWADAWTAIEMFFDIDQDIVFHLFTPHRYANVLNDGRTSRRVTPEDVIARIRQYIERG